MKFQISNQLWVNLLNFSGVEIYFFESAVRFAIASLLISREMPKLKSDVIYVIRNPSDLPRYRQDVPFELISVNATENKPFQFLYQFSHEMGHLMSQAGSRWEKPGRHLWIEEALCGAYSIYCIRRASEFGPPQLIEGARAYLNDYINKCYVETEKIDADWIEKNYPALAIEKRLSATIKPLSRLIADEFPNGDFVSDNIALRNTPLDSDLKTYLRNWAIVSNQDKSVPKLLIERLGLY